MFAFRMPSMEDSNFTTLSIPNARTMFPRGSGSIMNSSIRDEPHSMLPAMSHGRQPLSLSTTGRSGGHESINSVSSGGSSPAASNNNDAPDRRRRGRHVRSTFVFDGNNFTGSVSKPETVERAATSPGETGRALFGSSSTTSRTSDPWYRQSTC
jgi:hypothetical protein